MERIKSVMSLVASDRPGRGASVLGRPEHWQKALSLLDAASRVVVVTGFYVPEASAAETDGPGGALVLARALERDGKKVLVVTDSLCFDVVASGASALNGSPTPLCLDDPKEIWRWRPDLLVYVERPGRCGDGCFRNMRGCDISAVTAPLDAAAFEAVAREVPLLAIGDGGNEAGMASFLPDLATMFPHFASSLSVVSADAALAVDVSNWGAYGLCCLLSGERGIWLGHGADEEERLLRALVAAGAVDGVTKHPELSVDGFPLSLHKEVAASLVRLWESWTRPIASPSKRGVV